MLQSDLKMKIVITILVISNIAIIRGKHVPLRTPGIVPDEASNRVTRNLDLASTDEEMDYSVDPSAANSLTRSARKVDNKPHEVNSFPTDRSHDKIDHKREEILVEGLADKVKKIEPVPLLTETSTTDDELLMLNWMGSSTYEKMPFIFEENQNGDDTVTDKVKPDRPIEPVSVTETSTTDDELLMLNWMGSSTYEKMPFFQENSENSDDKLQEEVASELASEAEDSNELLINWMGDAEYYQPKSKEDEASHRDVPNVRKTIPNKLGSLVKS